MTEPRIYKVNNVLYVTVDKDAFLLEVQKVVDLSPVFSELTHLKGEMSWPAAVTPPQLWDTLKDITTCVSAICSAVEIAKQAYIKVQDPSGDKGLKFDKEVALRVAVDLLASSVKFKGFLGAVVNSLWKPFLNVLVSMYVSGQSADWLQIAMSILKIANVAGVV